MSNWWYGEAVPTSPWRSAMTLPRDLTLVETPNGLRVASLPSNEVSVITRDVGTLENVSGTDSIALNLDGVDDLSKSLISGTIDAKDFQVEFRNSKGQKIVIGFDEADNQFFIDRGEAGNRGFSERFVSRGVAPRLMSGKKIMFTIALDVSSVEVFFDGGVTVITAIYFPDAPLATGTLRTGNKAHLDKLSVNIMESIWH
jgi:sucrose-6-phosphate hydrolase SacC (GH32 family)